MSQQQQTPPYGAARVRPRPLGLAIVELPILYIRALFSPVARFFAAEGERATWGIVWVQLLLLIIIPGALGLVRGYSRSAQIRAAHVGTDAQGIYNALATLALGSSVAVTLAEVLAIPILFFVGVTFQFLLAKAFRGLGGYLSQAYTTLLFAVPLVILSSLINTLLVFFHVTAREAIAPVVSLALLFYGILLNIAMIVGVHRLTRGRATAVVVIPYIIGVLVAVGLLIYFARLIINAIHDLH